MGGRLGVTPARRATGLVAVVAAGVLSACTTTVQGQGTPAAALSGPSSSGSATTPSSPQPTSPSSSPGDPSCPSTYAAPDPNRPRVTLSFTISADHATVKGRETIAFTPDLPITELVFRLTANTIPTVHEGNRIVVTSASADHGGTKHTFTAANADASTQGGLLHIPFGRTVAAGTTVTATLRFTVTLGINSFDRFGRAGPFAYFGSAQPLLSWQRGFGWHSEDMINFPAESATSEAMDTDLTVIAPAGDTVIMSGDPADPPKGGATRTWHSTISTARDVSVSAGPFAVTDRTVGGVKLRVGAPDATVSGSLTTEFIRAINELSARFGPYPFPSLSVARLPAEGGGIEYPSSILMLNGSRLVAVHETAHQWFYAMVGDSQALHPWLDEAFAQYSEELVNNDAPNDNAIDAPGSVDASTESYGQDVNGYYFTTYNKGAAALHAARQASGPARWDRALRCYVAANAWRIVVPADLAAAIKALRPGVAVLRQAGALKP
jgi:hypothetical protein